MEHITQDKLLYIYRNTAVQPIAVVERKIGISRKRIEELAREIQNRGYLELVSSMEKPSKQR